MTECSNCKHNQGESGKEVQVPILRYPETSIEEALGQSAPFVKVCGAAGSGKTEYLVRKAADLCAAGMAPESICIVVNTAYGREALTSRLVQWDPQLAAIHVTTIMDLCIEALNTPSAIKEFGRGPRVLADMEYKLLLEDLKTLGQQPSRLKKMLNFFYFQWSQLEPEREWLLPKEEAGVRSAFDRHLRIRNAMIREELAPLAAAFLSGEAADEARHYACVMVDDYQNLSKASQSVCDRLSEELLIVTGNENQMIEGFDPYPFREGLSCFEIHHEGAACMQLVGQSRCPRSVAAMADRLCSYPGLYDEREAGVTCLPADCGITAIKWKNPEEEFSGLARTVKDLLDRDRSLQPGDIYLIAPNRNWAGALSRSLSALGIASAIALDGQPLSGDPRTVEKALDFKAYALLSLAADMQDVVAWRSWCGVGDYLCYSGAWGRLEDWAEQNSLSIPEALAALANNPEEPFLEAGVLGKRYAEASALVANLAEMTGFNLIKAVERAIGATRFGDLVPTACGNETAAELQTLMYESILEPAGMAEAKKVQIGSYKLLQGRSFRIVLASGLIDGWMPSRNSFDAALLEKDRESEKAKYRRIFYNAITKCEEALVLSSIQTAPLELAELMKMEVRRVKMEHNQRIAMLSPAVFLEEAGDCTPSMLSGQQYLAGL